MEEAKDQTVPLEESQDSPIKQSEPIPDVDGWFEIRLLGKLPERRSYHSCSVSDNYLYIYAGQDIKERVYDSLWRVNLDCISTLLENDPEKIVEANYQFELMETTGQTPGPISHHSTEAYNGCLYLFGGAAGDNDNEELYKFDIKSSFWGVVEKKGDCPISRDDHCSCIWQTKMVIFSGFVKGTRSNDIYTFDFETEEWECLFKDTQIQTDPMTYPIQRAAATMTVIGDVLWIFAGQDEDNNKLNDLWTFDMNSKQWQSIDTNEEDRPHQRTGMTSFSVNGKFIFFGGILEVTKETNDVYEFDPQTKIWKTLCYEEDKKPGPAYARQHTLAVAANTMTNQKGVQKKDTKTPLEPVAEEGSKTMKPSDSVATLRTKRKSPKKRTFSQSPKRRQTQKKKKEVDEGGEGEKKQERLNSPTSLTMSNTFIVKNADTSFDSYYSQMRRRKGAASINAQRSKVLPKTIPTARDGHSGVVYQDKLIVFGGDRHHMPFNDMYYLKITK